MSSKMAKKPPGSKNGRYSGTVPPLRPQLHQDTFMARVDVEDHIIPIWEQEAEVPESESARVSADVQFEYSYSLESFIKRSSIATDYSVSSYDDEFERYSESEEEQSVRGVYLDSVTNTRQSPDLLDPECHPIYIEGVAVQNGTILCVDMSPYSDQFAILEYEWYIGVEDNCPDRYQPEPIGKGKQIVIPLDAVGKYVFCRAHRVVELQTLKAYSADKIGVYDPHVNVAKNAGYLPEPQFHTVSSWSVTGPVSMCDELCLEILKALSEGVYKAKGFLSFNAELSRELKKVDSKKDGGKITLSIYFDALTIQDYKQNHGSPCTVEALKQIYEANVLYFEGDLVKIDLGDFEIEESNTSNASLLISIHKRKGMLMYLRLTFLNIWGLSLFVYILGAFRQQKNLRRVQSYWLERLEAADVSCVNDLLLRHIFEKE